MPKKVSFTAESAQGSSIFLGKKVKKKNNGGLRICTNWIDYYVSFQTSKGYDQNSGKKIYWEIKIYRYPPEGMGECGKKIYQRKKQYTAYDENE